VCFIFHFGDVAKFSKSRVPRFLRGHATLNVVLRLNCDVIADVLAEFLDHALTPAHD
jgi:hypothetical protein